MNLKLHNLTYTTLTGQFPQLPGDTTYEITNCLAEVLFEIEGGEPNGLI